MGPTSTPTPSLSNKRLKTPSQDGGLSRFSEESQVGDELLISRMSSGLYSLDTGHMDGTTLSGSLNAD